jgi:hypothetical protein
MPVGGYAHDNSSLGLSSNNVALAMFRKIIVFKWQRNTIKTYNDYYLFFNGLNLMV